MNVAFPALLVFLLVLPGIILRYTYARGPWRWGNPTSLGGLADEIAYSVLFAIVLHFMWLTTASMLGFGPRLDVVLLLLIGSYGHESALLEPTVLAVANHPGQITGYFLTICAAAALAGWGGHAAVRATRLDLRSPIFRFKNDWYYLLSGEALSFADSNVQAKRVDGVYLSAVVDYGGHSYLYRGLVQDFFWDHGGNLDRIVLRLAHRRRLVSDRGSLADSGPHRYYDIKGDFFILRYSEIKTMNLDYFSITTPDDPPS